MRSGWRWVKGCVVDLSSEYVILRPLIVKPNESSRREDQDSSHCLTVIRPEVSFVSGNKVMTVRGYRRCQDRPIFCLEINRFWQVWNLGWIAYDPRLREEVLESGEPVRFGKDDITSSFFYCVGRSHEFHVWKLP